jgi:TetR/AcrR family transcriptional repressor of nem operon
MKSTAANTQSSKPTTRGKLKTTATTRAPEATRGKILNAAFLEFYKHGFQGGSLNHIVEVARTTKGALFHHFPQGKQQLGYAVVDEVIGPILKQRWLDPLTASADPIEDLKRAFRQFVQEDIQSGHFVQGCPLNNLAQEMSPLDEGFRGRIDHLYSTWRACYAGAFAAAIDTGRVRKGTSPHDVAALVVASQMGIWGTGKSSRDPELMKQASEAVCAYLDSLKS